MAIAITDKAVQNILDTGYDAVFNGATLEIRSGTAPGPGLAPTGTLLCAITLPADAFASTVTRTKAKAGTWSGTGAAAGSAGHYRLKATGDTAAATQTEARQEGTVTATGGGGDLTLDNVSIAVGQVVTVNTFTVSIP